MKDFWKRRKKQTNCRVGIGRRHGGVPRMGTLPVASGSSKNHSGG